jgi:hypothetical protein
LDVYHGVYLVDGGSKAGRNGRSKSVGGRTHQQSGERHTDEKNATHNEATHLALLLFYSSKIR